MESILFFDARAEGHHSEYAQHLVRYAAEHPELGHLHFVLPRAVSTYAPPVVEAIEEKSHLHLHKLSADEEERIDSASLLWRSFVEWTIMMRYARRTQADHCVLLELNVFQLALGLFRRLAQVEVSGILFFPYPRIEPDGKAVSDQLLCRLEKLRKHLQLRWMLRNRDIGTVFLLNDGPSAEHLNQLWPERRPFQMLPDPVAPLVEEREEEQDEGLDEAAVDAIEEESEGTGSSPRVALDASEEGLRLSREAPRSDGRDRIVFLMFGALREEKGVREGIEAFRQLPAEVAGQATLCLLGKVRADLEDEFPALVASLRRAQPKLHVHVENRFLPEGELHEALQSADVVLSPYLRTEGSSGVIGHAARYRVPVVGPNTGLLRSLIEEYDLGVTIDATDPCAIANAIRGYIEGGCPRSETAGMRRYVEERTPSRFAEVIFNSVLDGSR